MYPYMECLPQTHLRMCHLGWRCSCTTLLNAIDTHAFWAGGGWGRWGNNSGGLGCAVVRKRRENAQSAGEDNY